MICTAMSSEEHNMSVLAAVRVLGEQSDKAGDWPGSIAAFILRAMTLLSHAKTIAQSEALQWKVLALSYSLGRFVDDLMKKPAD